MDDLDAEILGIPKPGSGLRKTPMKDPGKCDPLRAAVQTTGKLPTPGKGKKEILLFLQPGCKQAEGVFVPDREQKVALFPKILFLVLFGAVPDTECTHGGG